MLDVDYLNEIARVFGDLVLWLAWWDGRLVVAILLYACHSGDLLAHRYLFAIAQEDGLTQIAIGLAVQVTNDVVANAGFPVRTATSE